MISFSCSHSLSICTCSLSGVILNRIIVRLIEDIDNLSKPLQLLEVLYLIYVAMSFFFVIPVGIKNIKFATGAQLLSVTVSVPRISV